MIIGDVLCIIPQVAFQRGLGAVMEVSSVYDDETLTWGDVWKFETRVGYSAIMMFAVGSAEWFYLYQLTTKREAKTKLSDEEFSNVITTPGDIDYDTDIVAERTRSLESDDGINARDLVKAFRIKPSRDSKSKVPILKRSVKGVSFGIRKNEIFALLGPNGKSCMVTVNS
jgi:hypothetical protein